MGPQRQNPVFSRNRISSQLSDFRGQTDGPDGRIHRKIRHLVDILALYKILDFHFFSATKVMKNSFQSKSIQGSNCWISGGKPMDRTAEFNGKTGTRSKTFQNHHFFLTPELSKMGPNQQNPVFSRNPINCCIFGGKPMNLTAEFIQKSGIPSKFATFQNPGFSPFFFCHQSYEKSVRNGKI